MHTCLSISNGVYLNRYKINNNYKTIKIKVLFEENTTNVRKV